MLKKIFFTLFLISYVMVTNLILIVVSALQIATSLYLAVLQSCTKRHIFPTKVLMLQVEKVKLTVL